MELNIIKPGIMDYENALELQKKIHQLRLENKIPDTVILLEHYPVITLGRRGKYSNILIPQNTLETEKIKVFEVNRGGDVTYHGPGQLVGYLFFDLKKQKGGIKNFVWNIQEVFIRLLSEYSIQSERKDKTLTGVWIGNDKITAIGIYVSHWITMHGFSFNVNTDLSHYKFINPCGIQDKGVTSLEKITGEKIDFNKVTDRVSFHLGNIFQMTIKEEPENEILKLINN
jgi:lipoyl(octanoyl) transferase